MCRIGAGLPSLIFRELTVQNSTAMFIADNTIWYSRLEGEHLHFQHVSWFRAFDGNRPNHYMRTIVIKIVFDVSASNLDAILKYVLRLYSMFAKKLDGISSLILHQSLARERI